MSKRNRSRRNGSGNRRQDSSARHDQNNKGGGTQQGQKPNSRQGRKRGRGGEGRNPKANMVLLVDSDHDYVEMESKAVVNYVSGYNPMGFTDAARAISYLSNPRNRGRIGLVMLNVDLESQGDGQGVAELIGMLSPDPTTLLAVVSDSNSSEKLEHALSVSANGLLTKPFTIERFVRFVKGILRTSESTSWQCETCGKMVIADQIDMLKMKPFKCSDRECNSNDLRQIEFPPTE